MVDCRNEVVPIVMGASKEDYNAVAPPGSFIHVDDFRSPRHLAGFLHLLAANSSLYNTYFHWHTTGEFINTATWCRLCALLHDGTDHVTWYRRFNLWWQSDCACTTGRWDDPHKCITDWSPYNINY